MEYSKLIEIITIDWHDKKSIQAAKENRTQLENAGYIFTNYQEKIEGKIWEWDLHFTSQSYLGFIAGKLDDTIERHEN